MIAVCHSLGICLDLSQVPLHLVLFLFQMISLKSPKISPRNKERRMGTYPSPLHGQQTPETAYKNCQVLHGSCGTGPWTILTQCIDNPMTQQHPHHTMVGTLLRTMKGFQNAVHYQCLMPHLIIQGCALDPMMIPSDLHHHKVHPLEEPCH